MIYLLSFSSLHLETEKVSYFAVSELSRVPIRGTQCQKKEEMMNESI